jgi:vitamin B12 transporter
MIRRRGAELRLQLTPGPLTATTFGVQVEQQDQRSQSLLRSAFGDFAGLFRAVRRNAAAYSEVTVMMPSPQLTATLGARFDDNEQFGEFGTGRAGISWHPPRLSATRVRATVGNAFREPSFFENYSTGFVVGNPDLRPERTTSADAGIEQQFFGGRAQLAVTGFAQRFRNMIDYTSDTSSCHFNYCNVAEARANGLEVELGARAYGPVHASVSGTLLDTRVLSPGFDTTVFATGLYRTGEQLIRRPRNKWTAELSYRDNRRLFASARLIAVGKRNDRDFRPFPNQPVTLSAYQRVDLAADYTFLAAPVRRSSLTFRVENLGNTAYQNIFNFLAPRRRADDCFANVTGRASRGRRGQTGALGAPPRTEGERARP